MKKKKNDIAIFILYTRDVTAKLGATHIITEKIKLFKIKITFKHKNKIEVRKNEYFFFIKPKNFFSFEALFEKATLEKKKGDFLFIQMTWVFFIFLW